jgi:hypothetical protein
MPKTYNPIARTKLTSASATITFSGIPSSYTDLVLICNTTITTGNNNIHLEFNTDTGNNYSVVGMWGNGSGIQHYNYAPTPYTYAALAIYNSTSEPMNSITNIMNYSNTTTYKTLISRASRISLGTETLTSTWRSTAAINRIDVKPSDSTFAAGSTFTLYGILKA